jgi:hypothetical protein
MAVTAIAASAAAVFAYAWNQPFTETVATGTKLVPGLAAGTARVGAIVIGHGGKTLTLETKDEKGELWTVPEAAGFPAEPDRVRALLVKLAQAEKVDAKTRLPDRHALLEVEDPGPEAKSRSLRLVDGRGSMIADLIVGKRRYDAFGSGRSGSYVRTPGETQAWLASFDADVGTELRSWVKPSILELDAGKIESAQLDLDTEDPLDIARTDGKAAFTAFPPDGRKLRDANAADALLRAAAQIDLEDVRRSDLATSAAAHSVLVLKSLDGVTRTLRLRTDGEARWLTVSATGEGDTAKAAAEAANRRTSGFEFKIPASKADQIFKTRNDLLEPAG